MKKVFSVVIPAFNEERTIATCIKSVLEQDFRLPYEVIVVDNNSQDATAEIAKKAGVKVVRETKKGYVLTLKKGVEAARGEIIAITDADTIVPKNWLTSFYSEYEKDERVVGVAGGFYYNKKGLFWKIFAHFQTFFSHFFTTSSGFNMSFKKAALVRVGGVNTEINLGADVDIFQRLKKVGRCVYLPNVKAITSARRFETIDVPYFGVALITYLKLVFLKKTEFHDFTDIRK